MQTYLSVKVCKGPKGYTLHLSTYLDGSRRGYYWIGLVHRTHGRNFVEGVVICMFGLLCDASICQTILSPTSNKKWKFKANVVLL